MAQLILSRRRKQGHNGASIVPTLLSSYQIASQALLLDLKQAYRTFQVYMVDTYSERPVMTDSASAL